MSVGNFDLLILVSFVFCLLSGSLGFDPLDNYLIDCGSFSNKTVSNRLFLADVSNPNIISNPEIIFVNTTSNPSASPFDASLLQTARIFNRTSNYTFPIKEQGRHWIRLYFFPFDDGIYNLSTAKFSVSAQNFTLLKENQIENGYEVKEYSLNITSDFLVLTFTPLANSFAFINALEVVSLPDVIIPKTASTKVQQGINSPPNLWNRALQTVARVNMGNRTVPPETDTLSRLWVSDNSYLSSHNLVTFVSNLTAVNLTSGSSAEDIAPHLVYGSATTLLSYLDERTNANVTWHFDVDPGFEYLIRFHFCDIVSLSLRWLFFSVYVDSWLVDGNVDLSTLTSNTLGAPYFMDVIARVDDGFKMNISVGRSKVDTAYPNGILNGLEIMKISNSDGGLDFLHPDMNSSQNSSKVKIFVIAGSVIGLFVAVLFAVVIFVLCRRRKTSSFVGHTKEEDDFATSSMFSNSKIGYRFPLLVILEATDNFSENLVIGVGGFGKVYKGALRDDTEVAVKRAAPNSQQGLAEFRTEIEMLSQFRHRHLVSLIGYCDEQNEMIIIYEYMKNGTLKDHLYGLVDLPNLTWRRRLEICIGSARGLHYLHTGSTKAIIHRDVKSANILLDENYMAKVADFGLSKTGPDFDKTHVSTAVKGSFGYLDPEYLTRQQLTEKSDVYSFGVVMFEILSGRPVIDPSLPRGKVNLVQWAMKLLSSEKLEEIMDARIPDQVKPESLRKFVEIARKCLAESGIDRPTMGDVLWNLESALQLQGSEKPNHKGAQSSQINPVDSWEASVSTREFSIGSADDLDGISMSKVFAQMVKEDMR